MNLIEFEELYSTNAYAKENFDSLNNFDVVSANLQTKGHGQFERCWYSTNKNGGNCYITIVLKPENITHIDKLTRYASNIVAKTLEKYNLKPMFKYPNDVLIDGKKIAGILAESTFKGSELKGIALGIGVNLNLEEKDLKYIDQLATSVFLETGNRVNKLEFMTCLLDNFYVYYDGLINHGIGGNIDV